MQPTKLEQSSRNLYQKAILSAYCLVVSDPITGFSSGKNYFSLATGHFMLYGDFVQLKVGIRDMACQRDHTIFIERPGWFRKRLFIRLGNLDDAIEIIGRNRKIITALKRAGYNVQSQQ